MDTTHYLLRSTAHCLVELKFYLVPDKSSMTTQKLGLTTIQLSNKKAVLCYQQGDRAHKILKSNWNKPSLTEIKIKAVQGSASMMA